MSRLLYIEASPRKERSHSIHVAEAFLEAWQAAHPDGEIDRLDIWAEELEPFDGMRLEAKYAILHGQPHTAEQAAAWQYVVDCTERFKAADHYLIAAPMWNFGIPYRLKHYIDIVTQPGLTFAFDPDRGYSGLVTGRPAVLVLARGGAYPEGSETAAYDMQKPYLTGWLGFIGFTDIRCIEVEPTLGPPQAVQAVRDAARQRAAELAASL